VTSHPVIEAELSPTQREFIDWIEARVGLQRHDGHAISVSVSRIDTDEDISTQRHTVEFLAAGEDGGATAIAYIRHTMKRIESGQGRYALIASRFELMGQDVPHVRVPYEDVERAVRVRLDQLKAAACNGET